MPGNTFTTEEYRARANLLKLMAHPVRLQILDLLRREAECVCHLSAALRKPQPYISQQLALLRNAGLIADRKEGSNVFYGLEGGPEAGWAAGILEAVAGRTAVGAAAGHRAVAGCYCPRCDPGGTCKPRAEGS
jgi:DNA-binding transcriptional ArsR family regulator